MNGLLKPGLMRGLSAIFSTLLILALSLTSVANANSSVINRQLGTTAYITKTKGSSVADTTYFKSEFSSVEELANAKHALAAEIAAEGSVLLKNANSALPLNKDTETVTVWGLNSLVPTLGGLMGSPAFPSEEGGQKATGILDALGMKGVQFNGAFAGFYGENFASVRKSSLFGAEIPGHSHTVSFDTIPEPASSYQIGELPASAYPADLLASADNTTALVLLTRDSSEAADFTTAMTSDPLGNTFETPLSLSAYEREIIELAKQHSNGKVVVLINSVAVMEIEELKQDPDIDAILWVGLPGMYGFEGVADVLIGAQSPSGHLVDTYAVSSLSAPAMVNFGIHSYDNYSGAEGSPLTKGNLADYYLIESEGIYIGYKYYETRYADVVLGQGNAASEIGSTGGAWNYDNEVTYTFGYGLSYTTFDQKITACDVDLASKTAKVTVEVTNTGDVAGKDAVQLYVSVPYTDYDREHLVEKSAIQLLDFGKTGIIEPGKTETVELTADLYYMASWDSTSENAAGTTGCYILDDGDYYFTVGNGAHEALNNVLAAQGKTTADGMTADGNAENVIVWNLDKLDNTTFAQSKNGTAVENQLADMDLNYWMPGTVTYLTRNDWAGTFPKTYSGLTATGEMLDIMDNDVYVYQTGGEGAVTWGAQNGLTLANLKGVTDPEDERWDLLIDQMELSEALIRTAFGGTSTKSIPSITSPEAIQNDGPTGFANYPIGQYGTKDASTGDPCVLAANDPNAGFMGNIMANNIVVAQTFSKALALEWGEIVGNYSLWSNCAILWGISANQHRLPYCARNLEYYSEDPVLSSFLAAQQTIGEQKYGVIASVKHFAFNDTEMNRTGVAPFMTEQKAREGDIRCMQSPIEDGKCLGVMTAYNRAGVYTDNSHTGLIKNILHGEFGFYGLISEDFIMDPGYVCLKEAVQNGITMSCNTGDNSLEAVAAYYPAAGWNLETVGADATVQQALKDAMKMQNYAIANSNAMDGLVASSHLEVVKTWYDNLFTGLTIASAILFALCAFMLYRTRKD